jgi:hypothetical protein
MAYETFGEKAHEVGGRLQKLAKNRKLSLSDDERASLEGLSNFVSGLPGVLERGGTLDYKKVRIVETLQKALDVVEKDGAVKLAEVKKLLDISKDLEITDEEMASLEKEGEEGN